eukprot:3449519-Alexandrium_andersonii.AAC.1
MPRPVRGFIPEVEPKWQRAKLMCGNQVGLCECALCCVCRACWARHTKPKTASGGNAPLTQPVSLAKPSR